MFEWRLSLRALTLRAEYLETAMSEVVEVFPNLLRRMPLVALYCLLALFGEAAFGVEPKVAVTVGQKTKPSSSMRRSMFRFPWLPRGRY